jgi:hypothetical protein
MLNGEPGEIIQQQHGLQQGDPLSPMLFILVMDVLNSQIVKAGAEGLSRQRLPLYADDVVALFIKLVEEDLQVTRDNLQIFGDASGLETNLQKATSFPFGVRSLQQ